MLDQRAVDLQADLRALGLVIDAASIPIISGKECCGWCDPWLGSCTDTRHGFCPVLQCMTSPHYVCPQYEED
ncbi:MAG: hypothetical protein ACYDHX_07760 [Methanothrix sp.]